MSTALVIDARTREQKTFTASVAAVGGNQHFITIRHGAAIGSAMEVFAEGSVTTLPVVTLGDYSAQSSAGFSRPISTGPDSSRVGRVRVIGGSGFGRHPEGGLRVYGRPIYGYLVPAGASVRQIKPGHGGSNPATANATFAGLELLGAMPGNLILAEGQSDYVRGLVFTVPEKATLPEWPPEHQTEHFIPEKVLATACRAAKVDEWALRAFVAARGGDYPDGSFGSSYISPNGASVQLPDGIGYFLRPHWRDLLAASPALEATERSAPADEFIEVAE